MPDIDNLSQLKLTLSEKLKVLKHLDSEILDMVEEDQVDGEIDQLDVFKEGVYSVMVRIALTVPSLTLASPGFQALATAPSSVRNGNQVKLPKLTIRPLTVI